MWTNLLIVFVMMLTFLNLVVVSGILVGLIESSSLAYKKHHSGDIIISNRLEKTYIERSQEIMDFARSLPEVASVSGRYIESGKLESRYKERTRAGDILDNASGLIVGIDPEAEDRATGLSTLLIEGEYLNPTDEDQIMIGANLLFKYSPIESPGLRNLKTAGLGSKVRLTVHGNTREVTIKGIIKSKVGEIDQRIFMNERILRKLIGRSDLNMDEIVIRLVPGADPLVVKTDLVAEGYDAVGKIQTSEESQPKFLKDIQAAFAMLGNLIGSVGLVVASITVFIVIFVNAITRRKYIGILKGIGISSRTIEIAYMFQSLLYAVVGTAIGIVVLYVVLVPFVDAHPINFPFSNGILVAPWSGTLIRAGVLFVATLIAGYIPAKIIVRQNTLDAILGR
jgi:putative ABC transport system permease protein